jgi:threonine/homoserine/homoserine lactone efflux protein
MGELVAFLGVAVLVIVTPGPDTAVTIRSALTGGRTAGVMTASGVITGQACWTVAASAGVTALLVASEPAFVALKLIGAAYLIYLGAQSLYAAWTGRGAMADLGCKKGVRPSSCAGGAAYRQGLLSDLSNPKMAAFFTSLLPQFGTSFATMLAFGLLFCALTWLWLVLYSFAIDRLGDALRRSAVRRTIEAATGTVLVALGLRLAAEPHRPR